MEVKMTKEEKSRQRNFLYNCMLRGCQGAIQDAVPALEDYRNSLKAVGLDVKKLDKVIKDLHGALERHYGYEKELGGLKELNVRSTTVR